MSKVTWCAEVGSMHKGEKSLAFEMIRAFSEAGADIIKFQFGWTEEAQAKHGLTYNPVRYVDEWAQDLARWCRYFDVELMASIWSLEGLEAARRVNMKRYKISHQVAASDPFLCDLIQRDYKETFMSAERPAASKHTHKIYVPPFYPAYPDMVGMPPVFAEYGGWYGYSDHSHGIEPCLLAVSRGALYIEKHVCLSKADLSVRDTPFSATPDEFAQLVRLGNGMRRLLDAGA